jgi:primase-polymerase (primpol)-like protein
MMVMLNNRTFPESLATLLNWVNWRLEPDKNSDRTIKVPYNPHTGYKASSTNPKSWGTLEQALLAQEKYLFSGIGFVFTEKCGIIGIDIDKCLADGNPNTVAADILAMLPPTYIELSPSSSGLHIFLRGALPKGGNRSSKTGVEMYAKTATSP